MTAGKVDGKLLKSETLKAGRARSSDRPFGLKGVRPALLLTYDAQHQQGPTVQLYVAPAGAND